MKKILCVIVVFCALFSIRLGYPPVPYFDEFFYVPAAKAFSHLSGYLQDRHPPLSLLSMSLSMNIVGENSWGWRLPSLLYAGCATALAGYLAFMLSGRQSLFWLVSGLLSLDGIWITQGRIALPNAPMIFFILLTLICWRLGHVNQTQRIKFWIIASVCAGLAAACKWQGALVIFVPILYYVFAQKTDRLDGKIPRYFWIYGILLMILAYLSTFSIVLFIKGMTWVDIFKLQYQLPLPHLLSDAHRDASYWYTWPFLLRPVWYGVHVRTPDLPMGSQIADAILCVGNPFLFMLFIPALIWIIWQLKRRPSPVLIVSAIGFLVFWIPSMAMGKLAMIYHFYPALVFMVMTIATMLADMLDSKNEAISLSSICLLILIFIGFLFFYPVWTGLPISDTFLRQHIWLPTWN